MYDPAIGRWTGIDPLAELDLEWSSYNFTLGNPINLIDPDGKSTHTDSLGNVLAVYNDGDKGVYSHQIATMEELEEILSEAGQSNNIGEKQGETEYWDEFVDPETGEVMSNTQILFDESWDPILEELASEAEGMSLEEIAANSGKGGKFDVKVHFPNAGRKLNGKFVSSRSAGNYLAGYNAAEGVSKFGFKVGFLTFQKLAGALHVKDKLNEKFSDIEKAEVVLTGKAYGPPPAYGENTYQYRMSKAGWAKRKIEKVTNKP